MNTEGLSATFVALADSLVADFDVRDFLDLLAARCGELLDVGGVGILLADPGGRLRVTAATSEEARLLELLQVQDDDGPGLECFRTGQAVGLQLSEAATRWPRFALQARMHGFGSVQALPMRLRDTVIGALDLFGGSPGLGPEQTHVAQSLADVATIGLLQRRAQGRAEAVARQLQNALDSRIRIEQAKGVLAERLGVEMDEAFDLLRGRARARQERISDLAARVLDGTEPFPGPDDPGPVTP